MSGLVLMMAVFANIVSNTSAAVIGTPIAVYIAQPARRRARAVRPRSALRGESRLCTPMADNCNLLVLNAGGYRFKDFVRVGVPLTLLMWITITIVLPIFFPLGS